MPDPSNKVYVAVVGDRHCQDYAGVTAAILRWLKEMKVDAQDVVIVSGGAKGVDTLAKRFAHEHCQWPMLEFKPDWSMKQGKSYAARVRNTKIVNSSDYVLAFPHKKSRGTVMTMNIAKQQGKPCYKILLGEKDYHVPAGACLKLNVF